MSLGSRGSRRGAGSTDLQLHSSTSQPGSSRGRAPAARCFARQGERGVGCSRPVPCLPSPSVSLSASLIRVFSACPQSWGCSLVFSHLITQINERNQHPAGSGRRAGEEAAGSAASLPACTSPGDFCHLGTWKPMLLSTRCSSSEPGGFTSQPRFLQIKPLLLQAVHPTDPSQRLLC